MYSVIPIITLREYDLSNVSATNFVELIVIKAFDMRRWRQATLQVRVKARTIADAASSLVFRLRPVSLSKEDPSILFVDDATAPVDLTVTSADTPPYLLSAGITFAGGSDLVRVSVRAAQGSAGGTLRGTIIADIVARSRP